MAGTNFAIIFLAIVLALILEQWAQRTSDLFFYQELGLDRNSLKQTLFVTIFLFILFFFIIWFLGKMDDIDVSEIIQDSV